MTTKPVNRGAIIRAAWSHARLISETLGQPIRSFIGATMRTAWALAKGMVPQSIPEMVPTPIPVLVPTPCQQQQANAGAIAPAPETQPNFLSEFEIELHEKALTKKFDLAVHKHHVLHEIYKETSQRYWGSRQNKSPNARRSKQEIHDRHVSDEMSKRGEAAIVEMNIAFDALEAFWRQRGVTIKPLIMVPQQAQQQQARDLRPPEPREIRVTALGHFGMPCDPEGFEASLWIVTDGRLSRDCASHQEALELAEDFRVWGYVVPSH